MSDEARNDAQTEGGEGVSAATLIAEAAAEADAERIEKEGRRAAFELLFVNGLYSSASLAGPVGEITERCIRNGTFAFDAYCTSCKREATFRVASRTIENRGISNRPGTTITPPALFSISAVCQRDFNVYAFVVRVERDTITKIGQIPSMADIAFGELRTIDRSLDKIDRRELGQALGLYAHDTALGAFVYLRRVFERMVYRAHERLSEAGHLIEGFATMRMDERVAALKGELPERAVQNSAVFSVLSVGLHELTEEQCAKYFPVVKAVLFQMLEQEEHKRKAAATARETEAALQRVLTDIGAGTA